MAVVYTRMVNPNLVLNYFVFFAPGLTITALFAAAFMIGREVNMEIRRDIIHYMLSLPIKRWELAFGRVLAGSVRGYESPSVDDSSHNLFIHKRFSFTTRTIHNYFHFVSGCDWDFWA